MGQKALRLRPSSVSCKTRLPTEGKMYNWSSKRIRGRPSRPALPAQLNLEYERKEDETEDKAESGKRLHREVRESPVWATIRDYLTPLDVLDTRTAGQEWNCAKLYGSFAALWFFLMKKDGREEGAQPEWPSLCRDHRKKTPKCLEHLARPETRQESGERCTKGTCWLIRLSPHLHLVRPLLPRCYFLR